jgi:pimeloyl-ACP methyl ester carboxylesterase
MQNREGGREMRENRFLEYKGCSIFYSVELKEKSDNWVVFLHGAGIDHRMFKEQIDIIPEDFNVLLWDARSHGKSRPSDVKFSMKQLIEDLLKIMEIEQINKAVFIGQSMGGNLSQEIAYYYPEKVQGLVLIDCTRNTGKLSSLEKMLLAITKPMLKLYPWKTLVKQSAAACGLKQEVKKYAEECFYSIDKDALIDILLEVTKCLHEDESYKIRVPFLLLCGDNDITGNIRKIAKEWAASEPNCTFHMISNAGHNSNQDNPEEVNSHIIKYLTQIKQRNI